MLLNYGVGEDSWESLGLQGNPTSPSWRRSALGVHWKDCCWSWNSNTLATSCEELTHWKSPWCWEGLGAGWEGDGRGWDGWMASPTGWAWVWVNSGNWWWTGRPGMLWFTGSQRVGHNWATELNWTEPVVAATAAAKSLQSCPTLCDPIDGSPPCSAIPGILQARTLEWAAISFSKDPRNHRYLFSDCMFCMMQCFAYNKVVSNFKNFFNCTNDKHRHLPVCSVLVCRT